MSYRYERYREGPRSSPLRRWVIGLTVLVWLLLLGLLLLRFVVRPLVTDYVQERVAERIPVQRPPAPDDGAPGPVAGDPGSFTITEADANQWLADHRGELQGVDDVRLHFVPGEVQADVTIAGLTSTARSGVQVVGGQIVATNPQLDPPLGLFVDIQPFATLIQNRLNSDLATTGVTVTGVRIESGQLVIAHQ